MERHLHPNWNFGVGKNQSYNGTIGANGGAVNFGFNANYSGTNAKPASFTLNGTVCR